MFSTHAFSASMALTVASLPIPAIPDQILNVSGNNYVVAKQNILIGGFAVLGAAIVLNYARVVSPSFRKTTPQMITPINTGLFAPDPALHTIDSWQSRALQINEQVGIEAGGAIVAIGQKAVLIWLADTEIKETYGAIIEARFQVTVVQAVNAWTLSTAFTFMDVLPVGAYNIVGCDLVAAGAVAARLVITSQTPRPGFIPRQLPTTGQYQPTFRRGRLGIWGSFIQDQVPQLEILGSVAAGSATYEGVMDLMPA